MRVRSRFSDYLKIDCEPSIRYFSVHPVGTWVQDVEPPESFVPISNGWSYPDKGGERQKAPAADYFGECTLPYYGEEVVFSVVRTQSFQPSGCRGCGTWRAIFEIRLNDHILTQGRHGRDDMPALNNVQFDGEEIRICGSPVPHHYREIEDGRSTVSCQILGGRQINEILSPDEP